MKSSTRIIASVLCTAIMISMCGCAFFTAKDFDKRVVSLCDSSPSQEEVNAMIGEYSSLDQDVKVKIKNYGILKAKAAEIFDLRATELCDSLPTESEVNALLDEYAQFDSDIKEIISNSEMLEAELKNAHIRHIEELANSFVDRINRVCNDADPDDIYATFEDYNKIGSEVKSKIPSTASSRLSQAYHKAKQDEALALCAIACISRDKDMIKDVFDEYKSYIPYDKMLSLREMYIEISCIDLTESMIKYALKNPDSYKVYSIITSEPRKYGGNSTLEAAINGEIKKGDSLCAVIISYGATNSFNAMIKKESTFIIDYTFDYSSWEFSPVAVDVGDDWDLSECKLTEWT